MSEDVLPKPAGFTVGPDPARQATDGDILKFVHATPTFDSLPRSARMTDWRQFEGMLLGVMFGDGSGYSLTGSAILVAPGIALASDHVFADHVDAIKRGAEHVMCAGIATHAAQGWTVRNVNIIDGSDICILGLEYSAEIPPHRTFYQTTISTRLPDIGECVMVAGFRAHAPRFEREAPLLTTLAASMLVSSGAVSQHYTAGRDRVLAPWSGIELDCPALGGMSGGPVFDSRGYLIGIVSTSLQTEDELSPTLAAVIWPILGQPFEGGWPPTGQTGKRILLEMAARQCKIERPEAVRASMDTATGRIETVYEPWK